MLKTAGGLSLSIANGIVGDYLAAEGNGLAQGMAFYHQGRPLPLTRRDILAAHPGATGKIVILVHGLCCNETLFAFPGKPGVDYGALLQKDLGYTPYYLRYNTGLHISENGQALAGLMDELVSVHPERVSEIVLLGHSKGGLVLRSACHYGRVRGAGWVKLVSRVFHLGSPHLGAPLEKLGNAFTWCLKAIPSPYTWVAADFINLRSAAIKDLRFGYTVDEEWRGRDPDALLTNNRKSVPLLPNARHYAVAGSLNQDPLHPVSRIMGDILVRVESAVPGALPEDAGGRAAPRFDRARTRLFAGLNHFALAAHPEVYGQILDWCREDEARDHDENRHGKNERI